MSEKQFKGAEYVVENETGEIDYKPEKIKRTTRKEITPHELFKKMRKLDKGGHYYFYGTDPDLFVKQAKFMRKFNDNYGGKVLLEQQYPSYNELSDTQLRTYFTWRTNVRVGIVKETSFSFVLMYIYELINNIGVKSSMDGMTKLMFIWKQYLKFDGEIEKYAAKWVKDYYVCNDFELTFYEIISEFGMESHYPDFLLSMDTSANKYEILSGISNYNFKESNFYTAKNEMIIADCFQETIINLTPLLDVYGMTWEKIIRGNIEKQEWWTPFRTAAYVQTISEDKNVCISPCEHYCFENGKWTAYRPADNFTVARFIIGYIIKKIEANLRVFVGHSHKLNPNVLALINALKRTNGHITNFDIVVSDPLFDVIIDRTCDLCFSPEIEMVTIAERLESTFQGMPYPLLKKMRTAKELKKAANPAQRFCMQAKIMCDAEDDFKKIVPFDNGVPLYSRMTNEQIRCYLTWRTSARQGVYYEVPEEYRKLYLFELINNIGVKDEMDVIKKMADLLLNCDGISKSEEKIICSWLKDYYICSNFNCTFYELIKECKIERYYPNVMLEFSETNNFEVYCKMASYKIEKSKFYKNHMEDIAAECLDYVLRKVTEYLGDNGINLKELLSGKGRMVNWWRPFSQAVCGQYKMPKLKSVVLCSNEVYSNKNGLWDIVILPEKNVIGSHLLGYIIKRMEVNLRVFTGYKYKITAEIQDITTKLTYNDSNLEKAILNQCFEKTIDEATLEYMKKNHQEVAYKPRVVFEEETENREPIEMKIDPSKFEKIRIEAAETREKLTTEEDEDEKNDVKNHGKNIDKKDEWESSKITTLHIEKEADCKQQKKKNQQQKAQNQPLNDENPWQVFYEKLNKVQLEAMIIILSENDVEKELYSLSQKNKVLLEVLFEEINEAALDYIGDTIIETTAETPYVYDEYVEKARNIFWKN